MFKHRIVLALGALASVCACAPPAGVSPTSGVDRHAGPTYSTQQAGRLLRPLPNIALRFPRRVTLVESNLLTRLNNRRKQAGVAALTVDPQLTAAAQSHSWAMASRRQAFLTAPDGKTMEDRLKDAGATYRPDVWYGYAWGPVNITDPYVMPIFILQQLENRFQLSPNYRRVGVAVYRPPSENRVYTTVFLAD